VQRALGLIESFGYRFELRHDKSTTTRKVVAAVADRVPANVGAVDVVALIDGTPNAAELDDRDGEYLVFLMDIVACAHGLEARVGEYLPGVRQKLGEAFARWAAPGPNT
jgi:hypothetical protein